VDERAALKKTEARWRRAARGALALAGCALGCSAPADRGYTRPQAVRTTPYTQHDIRVLGLRLRYIDEGPALPARRDRVVVLIPGHTSRIEEYDGLVPTLSRAHRVLVLDFPGSGYAEKPDREYTLQFYEDVLVAFLDQLGIGQCVLAGGSLGGNLVLRLGHRFPERFPRLVAWAPGSAWEAQPRLAALSRAVAGYTLFWPTVWIQSRFWYSKDWPGRDGALADTFAYYREVLSPGFVLMYWGMAADQVAQSLFPIAPEIQQPTLLMWGDLDNGANMGHGVARLHQLLPHNEFRIFPGARHSLAAEVPDRLADRIDEFLRRPASLMP
jgi:pimeloyl-ACP methyl ester carboxylesterase